jgi:ribulose-5-phosphate 4-epimerase/fuculose-1-phosphate aldolase
VSRQPTEAQVRIDLAAAYRLSAQRGWDDTIYTHLSAAVPAEPGCYLINAFGLRFDEITASSLVKVNERGEVVDGSHRKVNPTGFTIHGAVHAARPDAQCVIHLHAPWGLALSMLPEGLEPTSQLATYRQWVGDGSEIDGDLEWPALVRGLDRACPDFRS